MYYIVNKDKKVKFKFLADKIKLRIDGVIELHYKGSLKFIYKLEEGELFISEWDFAELTKEK